MFIFENSDILNASRNIKAYPTTDVNATLTFIHTETHVDYCGLGLNVITVCIFIHCSQNVQVNIKRESAHLKTDIDLMNNL